MLLMAVSKGHLMNFDYFPCQTGYDRLLSRLTRMHRAKNFALGVICDVRRLEMFIDFKHQVDRIYEDGSVAIIQR